MIVACFGFVAMMLGAWGMWTWREAFIGFLQGFFPVSVFFAGLVALLMGLTDTRSRRKASKAGSAVPSRKGDA